MYLNLCKRYLILPLLCTAAIALGAVAVAAADAAPSAPPVPYGLEATQGAHYDRIRVTWQDDFGLGEYRNYRVLRQEVGNPYFEFVGMGQQDWVADGGYYNDYEVSLEKFYVYKVQGCDTSMDCSQNSFGSNPGWVAQLPPPTGVQASENSSEQIHISWNTAPTANRYILYRKFLEPNSFLSLPGADLGEGDTSWNDTLPTRGRLTYYRLKACNDAGCSEPSEIDTGLRLPLAPTGLLATDGTTPEHVHISWNAVGGVVHFYRVLRASDLAGPYNGRAITQDTFYFDLQNIMPPSNHYYYKVEACVEYGAANAFCGARSAPDGGWVGPDMPPPTGVQASDGAYPDHVEITWNPVEDALYYELLRSEVEGVTGGWLVDAETPPFDDHSAVPGVTYHYSVRACLYNYCGQESASDAGYMPAGPPPAPSNVQASDGLPGQVEVTWNASEGATAYEVWRHGVNNFGAAQMIGTTSDTSFVDADPQGCDPFYYWVVATNGAGPSPPGGPDQGNASGCGGGGTATPTATSRISPTPTGKPTRTATSRQSPTATSTRPFRPTVTATATGKASPVSTATWTATATATASPASTAMSTATATPTKTPRDTATATATRRLRSTATPTNTTRPLPTETATDTPAPVPRPPSEVTASRGTYEDKVRVKWTSSRGATSYRILRGTTVTGPREKLASTRREVFDDTTGWPGIVYCYWIQACNENGCGATGRYARGYRPRLTGRNWWVNLPMLLRTE